MNLYFDNAATTKISEAALEAYANTARDFFANPSSVHKLGLEARKKLDEERARIASLLGVGKQNIVFTSGATESIASFFSSLLWTTPGSVIISKAEHDALSSWIPVLKHQGWSVSEVAARGGLVDPDEVASLLKPDTKAVAVMAVNNVTGAVEPIKEIAEAIRDYERNGKRKILFFSDSVQALGKTDLELSKLDIDAASFSGHKINGPRGIGMLYLRNPASFRPLSAAGGQEGGKRGGTENLPAIAALRVALEEWMDNNASKRERMMGINRMVREALAEAGYKILSPEKASPYIISFSSSLPSEVFARMLSERGISISSGSACSNNTKGEGERILVSMGFKPELAASAARVSFSNSTTDEEVSALIEALKELKNAR